MEIKERMTYRIKGTIKASDITFKDVRQPMAFIFNAEESYKQYCKTTNRQVNYFVDESKRIAMFKYGSIYDEGIIGRYYSW